MSILNSFWKTCDARESDQHPMVEKNDASRGLGTEEIHKEVSADITCLCLQDVTTVPLWRLVSKSSGACDVRNTDINKMQRETSVQLERKQVPNKGLLANIGYLCEKFIPWHLLTILKFVKINVNIVIAECALYIKLASSLYTVAYILSI